MNVRRINIKHCPKLLSHNTQKELVPFRLIFITGNSLFKWDKGITWVKDAEGNHSMSTCL